VRGWLDLIAAVPSPVLLAIDLDDTLLLPDGSLSARSADGIRRLRSSQIAVIPLTARRPVDVTGVLRGSGVGPLAVVSNGAAIWDLERDGLLSELPLPAPVVASVVRRVRQAVPGVVLGAEHLDDLVCEPTLVEVPRPSDDHGYRVADDLATVVDQPFSKVFCWHPEVGAASLCTEAQQAVGAMASPVTTSGRWVELLHPRANKGDALRRVCSLLQVPTEQVISVGNDANDLPMMRISGVSLAVANANPEILALADGVLPANADEGVATMLEALDELLEARRDDRGQD
jgi:Cof subfamily protein (haloacid dehalogenase superfamily)